MIVSVEPFFQVTGVSGSLAVTSGSLAGTSGSFSLFVTQAVDGCRASVKLTGVRTRSAEFHRGHTQYF